MKNVYAYKFNELVVKESSSGGAFTAIIYAWIKFWKAHNKKDDEIVIYGAAFDENFNIIHQRAECNNWKIFRKSKYGTSNIAKVLPLLKEDLLNNKAVVFSGTPCQIQAVLKFTNKIEFNKENLLTIDIICHGTPKREVWKDYVNLLENHYNSKIVSYDFRYKMTKSATSVVYVKFANGHVIHDTKLARSYLALMFTGLSLQNGCYCCKFANMNRVSDITIGDFWGAHKIFKGIHTDNGISEVIINTNKGSKIWNIVCQMKHDILIKCNSSSFLKYQHNLSAPTLRPKNTDEFWDYYNKNGYYKSIQKYTDCKKGNLLFYVKRILDYLGILNYIRSILK